MRRGPSRPASADPIVERPRPGFPARRPIGEPLGRAAQPAELAPAYVLLASREGSYMTGALVPVTGGTPML